MKIIGHLLATVLLFSALISAAQQTHKGRGLCQQEYIIHKFIEPQLKNGPLHVKKTTDIDSLFAAMETGWRNASVDSLKKYPSELTSAEFGQLDAYCYLWALASMTQNLNVGSDYGKTLSRYMNAAMLRDEAMIKRLATPVAISMIFGGNLGNTLAIGSAPNADNATFKETYHVYQDFEALFNRLAETTDTAVSHAARMQLKTLRDFYYPMHAFNSYLSSAYDQAFGFLVTGLSVDRYDKGRAIDLTKKLVKYYKAIGDKDRCYALLNVLALNSTTDNLDRAVLRSMYMGVDSLHGLHIYENFKNKLSLSAFKKTGKTIKLPVDWRFIKNNIPADRQKKAKYILVDVWYTGCRPCLDEIPRLNAFYSQIKQREDILFLSINTDYKNGKENREFVAKRANELKVEYPIYFDEPVLAIDEQLEVTGYPAKFIITNTGEILEKIDRSRMTLDSFKSFLKETN